MSFLAVGIGGMIMVAIVVLIYYLSKKYHWYDDPSKEELEKKLMKEEKMEAYDKTLESESEPEEEDIDHSPFEFETDLYNPEFLDPTNDLFDSDIEIESFDSGSSPWETDNNSDFGLTLNKAKQIKQEMFVIGDSDNEDSLIFVTNRIEDLDQDYSDETEEELDFDESSEGPAKFYEERDGFGVESI